MMIGYGVEGSTDRALVNGLKARWCPQAVLIEGAFRGSTQLSLRREYGKICDQFAVQGVDAMVFLTDANRQDWRAVQRNERELFPQERLQQAVHGVCNRNVESWLCADPHWIAQQLGKEAAFFSVDDPKGAFERAIGVSRDDRKEQEIVELIQRAPLRNWLISNPSFEDFYEQTRRLSNANGCALENLREAV
jgi:hypothetical protein